MFTTRALDPQAFRVAFAFSGPLKHYKVKASRGLCHESLRWIHWLLIQGLWALPKMVPSPNGLPILKLSTIFRLF